MAKKTKKFEGGGSTGGIKGGALAGAVGNAFQNVRKTIQENAAKYPEMVKPEGVAPGAAPSPNAVKIEVGVKPTAKDLYEEHMSMISPNKNKDDSLGLDKYSLGLDKLSLKKGGKVKAKKMASGGKVSSASKRADGIATKGKTRGRMI